MIESRTAAIIPIVCGNPPVGGIVGAAVGVFVGAVVAVALDVGDGVVVAEVLDPVTVMALWQAVFTPLLLSVNTKVAL